MGSEHSFAAKWADVIALAREKGLTPELVGGLCEHLTFANGAAISVRTMEGNCGLVYATDSLARRLEELQFTLGEGPCVEAFGKHQPVLVPDLQNLDGAHFGRWPTFVSGVVEHGVRAVYAFPMCVGAIGLGTVDFYNMRPAVLSSEDVATALEVADLAACSLLNLNWGSSELDDLPAGPSAYWPEVHQATGMVKVQFDASMNDAFLLLRAHAFAEGRPVSEVATDVVTGRLRFLKETA